MSWKNLVLVIGIALLSLLVFWTPFLAKIDRFWGIEFPSASSGQVGMETIVQNFDGLNYLVVAKSLYKPELINELNASFLTGNPPLYFTAHYPGLPILIRTLDMAMTGPQAILVSIVLSNIILSGALYLFFLTYAKNKKLATILALVALFLPARMLSDRAVGSNEPLFIGLVLSSLVLAKNKRYWWSAILGSLSIVTRSPGILLFGGYAIAMLCNIRTKQYSNVKTYIPYFLMPLTLLGVWAFYGYQHHNLLAYFQSGVSLNLLFPPFSIFGTNQTWISGMWREEIIYIYLLFTMGIVALGKRLSQKYTFATMAMIAYTGLYLFSIFFVAHRDIARYSLPIAPLVILGFESYLEHKWVRWILLGMILPIYLLGWQFVVQNVQPVADWTVLL